MSKWDDPYYADLRLCINRIKTKRFRSNKDEIELLKLEKDLKEYEMERCIRKLPELTGIALENFNFSMREKP